MWRIFLFCFALLAARQLWLQVIAAPRISANSYNPRIAINQPYRGAILARDGTLLASTQAGTRTYPFGRALAQTVGYLSSRYGTSGLEASYDGELTAPYVLDNPVAQLAAIFGHVAHARGATIVTTIDPEIERTLYDALSEYPRGAGVVIDPRNGDILALASVPSFDPQTLDSDFPTLRTDAESPLLNRAIDGLYPPGSTFKIVTAANALEEGVVTPDTAFSDPGSLDVGGFTVHDNEGEATGRQDLTGAFALSSNVDFAQIALDLGADRWFADAQRWGFGEAIAWQLPSQTDRLPSPASVTPSILAQLGFGQASLLVTPLRMALVASTIASGGNEPCPRLVREIREPDGAVRQVKPSILATPISEQTAHTLTSMMEAVVSRGTGTAASLPDVRVAGKTGTATNPAGRSHAWFVAFAPAQAPRVAVAILVENAGYGGTHAAPIARRVFSTALARMQS